MNKLRWRKNMYIVSAALLMGLCGCSRKKESKDDIASNLNTEENISTNTDGGQETGETPKHISYTLEDDAGKAITIDADVEGPKGTEIPSYKLNVKTLNDENLAALAAEFFDEGVYEVKKPYSKCNMTELQEEKNILTDVAAETDSEFVPYGLTYEMMELGDSIDNYSDANVVNFEDGQLFMYDDYHDDFGMILPMYKAKLVGEKDGEQWVIRAEYDENGENDNISLQPLYVKEGYDMGVLIDEENASVYGENQCTYSKEDARELSDSFMNGIGYTGYEVILERQTVVSQNSSKINGYLFTYALSTEGNKVMYYEDMSDEASEGSNNGVRQGYIEVFVDSYGVENVNISRMCNIEETLSENTALLDFSQIDEVAKDNLKKFIWKNAENSSYKVDLVRFGYVYAEYDGVYCLVPAWGYFAADNASMVNEYGRTCEVMINAIDGTVIYKSFFYEGEDE